MKRLVKDLDLTMMVRQGDFSELTARNVALKYAKNKDVVVCASDLMAIGAMNALIDMDIFRPVCGFDGITLMGYVGKQMNTIRQDFYSISSRAVEEVHQLMNGGEGHQVIMPHSIVKNVHIRTLSVKLFLHKKSGKLKKRLQENVFLCYPVYCKRTTYTKSQYCEGMKSRKVQEIPKAQQQEGYGG